MSTTAQQPMRRVNPKEEPLKEIHQLIIGGISPRPIALVSTVSETGEANLAPFSFFNAFGANPPMIAFSPARSGKTGEYKDTYRNLMSTKECTVQLVPYALVEQMNLCSAAVAPEVDEFTISGLTPLASELVAAPRVAESPYQMECHLHQMVSLGEQPGSGQMAICEVLCFHVDEALFDADNRIDPNKLDVVARCGKHWYSRASGDSLFELDVPHRGMVGWEGLPDKIRASSVLTGNQLGRLARSEGPPPLQKCQELAGKERELSATDRESLAATALDRGEVDRAWALLV